MTILSEPKAPRRAKASSNLFIFLAILQTMSCVYRGNTGVSGAPTGQDDISYSIKNLAATDALNRQFGAVSGKKQPAKTVGLFYLLWNGQHSYMQHDIYDIQALLDTDDEALKNYKGTPASPIIEFHYWGEPLYGYYNTCDPWIATRHVELMTMAGIDYIFIDATNTFVYPEASENLFNILLSFQEQGFNPPKVAYFTNTRSGTTVDSIYEKYYQSGKYESLWYKPNGKPMIIGITENNGKASDQTKYEEVYGKYTDYIKPALQAYFDVRESQWPNGDYNPNSFPWMSWQCPQRIHNGSVNVPAAQHSHTVISASSMHPECSRGYNNFTQQVEEDWTTGANFQTMWDAVFSREDSINDVHITGFNEWIAQKLVNDNTVFFVDVYNHEFSRDIEMMKGGSNDNFYLQMVRNVRKFKFEELEEIGNNPYSYAAINIHKANEEAWQKVTATYRDYAGDAMPRNFVAAAGPHKYVDNSNRNDITEIKVTHDRKNVYFRVKTLDHITPYNGEDVNWMNILIKTDERTSFEGYRYIINRKPNLAKGVTSVEKSTGGYNWQNNGYAQINVSANIMQVAIPLSALGLSAKSCRFDFKVADNVTKYDDIMDYYVTGDSAPIGRLNFRYGY